MPIRLLIAVAPPPALFFVVTHFLPQHEILQILVALLGLLWLFGGTGLIFPNWWPDDEKEKPPGMTINFDKGRSQFATLPTVQQNGIWTP